MSATAQVSRTSSINRRRRVRQKVHAPAYASFTGVSKGEMLDLYEVLDISELGLAIQCPSVMPVDSEVQLCLDLAEASGQINSIARVVWSDQNGRVGLSLPTLPATSLRRLREWLFLNAMAGAANAASASAPSIAPREHAPLRPNYTDTLSAAAAVQREVEAHGGDLDSALMLVASRAQSLLRASGAAIAITADDPDSMVCRASTGVSAPPVGAVLQIGSGFSGECVKTAKVSLCMDTEYDRRVDRDSCRALEIRSLLAAPIGASGAVIGLIEVFSARPGAFHETESAVLQRLAAIVSDVFHKSERQRAKPRPMQEATPPPSKPPLSTSGSILFAQVPENIETERETASQNPDKDHVGGIRLPRAHLYLLVLAAATIALALGFILAPWIQPWMQRNLHSRDRNGEPTVLASSEAPDVSKTATSAPAIDTATLDQLRGLARQGDAAAEDKLGRLYAEGDEKQGIQPNDTEAARWFTSAAEHGNVSAQYKLGLLYWGGHHGLPKDTNKAYFWTVLARAGGQQGSKDLAALLAGGMTRAQATAIEQQAEVWYQRHESNGKPSAAR